MSPPSSSSLEPSPPPVDEELIHSRIQAIRAQIPEHVEIMAVSKGYSVNHIRPSRIKLEPAATARG